MKSDSVIPLQSPDTVNPARSILEELARKGAVQILQAALVAEADEFVRQFWEVVDEQGKRVVVRNGYLPEREITTGIGPLSVKKPRVRDRTGERKLTSKILPPFMRRTPSIDA